MLTSIIAVIQNTDIQIFNQIVFILYRGSVFGWYLTTLTATFPMKYFGRLYGLGVVRFSINFEFQLLKLFLDFIVRNSPNSSSTWSVGEVVHWWKRDDIIFDCLLFYYLPGCYNLTAYHFDNETENISSSHQHHIRNWRYSWKPTSFICGRSTKFVLSYVTDFTQFNIQFCKDPGP